MKPILFEESPERFDNCGLGVLTECISCIVSEERHGEYSCEFDYPVSGRLFPLIAPRMLIKIKANNEHEPQFFRIYKCGKPRNSRAVFYCWHISYDLAGFPVVNAGMNGNRFLTAGEAITEVKNHAVSIPGKTGFNAFRIISTDDTERKNGLEVKQSFVSLRAALVGSENSVVDKFGGEWIWDNFNATHVKSRGRDTGIRITQGKNMNEIQTETDFTNVYTGVLGYARQSVQTENVDEREEVIFSDLQIALNDYGENSNYERILIQDFTDEIKEKYGDDTDITVDKVKERVNNWVVNQNGNNPDVSVAVSFEDLSGQSYDDYVVKQDGVTVIIQRDMEALHMSDIVNIYHEKAGINIKARIVRTKYDCLLEKYVSLDIGTVKADLTDRFMKTGVQVTGTIQSI